MAFNYDYHKSQKTLHVGCEKPRAYFVPFHSEDAALGDNRAQSRRFLSLCGDWDFRFYPTPDRIEDFTSPDFNGADMEKMQVPRSWQSVPGRGYDTPNYTNVRYPFPVEPPHVPDANPSALYARQFTIAPSFLDGREIYMNFEGVDSCFYLFINDTFVGYSQVSHMTSEFNVTPFVHTGANTVKVLVFKWSDGSYLEDQDKFRWSGIFREVYLLSRDKIHLTDVYCRPMLNGNYSQGVLNVAVELNGEREIAYRLLSPDGAEESAGSIVLTGKGEFEMLVAHPALWSDEIPALYTLLITCGDEHVCLRVGFRHIVIDKRVIYINGKKVKAKGVNRHDSHPYLGSATPIDHILNDLYILKRHNVNMIRTSHYPNDPRLYGLCDRLGIYLCDETDLETHGMQTVGDWDFFVRSPEWTEALLDRVTRMFERDKNHPAIIMWSLGNESGMGDNQRVMSEYIRSRMENAIVHCEDISRRLRGSKKAPEYEDMLECPWVDVESRMYPSVPYILEYLNDKRFTKPFFLCEYCHAMGNGPGDLQAYWDAIWAHDSFFGGCVWEFLDHSVATGDNIYADPHFIYGGDYGDFPNDGNFCVDGLVYPNRKPHIGMLEYKQVLRPFIVTELAAENGGKSVSFRLRSRRFFRDLSDLGLYWNVERDGRVIRSGFLGEIRVAPERSRKYVVDLSGAELSGDCYFNVSVKQLNATEWADAGYEVGTEQFRLEAPVALTSLIDAIPADASLCAAYDEQNVTVTTAAGTYTVSKSLGLITSIVDNGTELLASPIAPTIWRAPTDNDRRVKNDWSGAGFDRAKVKCYSCGLADVTEKTAVVRASLSLGASYLRPILHIEAAYTFFAEGGVKIDYTVQVREGQPPLPRFGIRFMMPEGTERLRYFGRGPVESYRDKRLASRQGVFETMVTDHFEHYVRPQENMAHADTQWMAAADLTGHGITALETGAAFSFNCCHFTSEQLTVTGHDYDLKPIKETVVNIDYKHAGIGSNSCGPALSEELQFTDKEFSFSVRLLPSNINDIDPFAESRKR